MHYFILIQWSDEDHVYLVTLPEWEGHTNIPTTHGATYEEALQHGQEVLTDQWTSGANTDGRCPSRGCLPRAHNAQTTLRSYIRYSPAGTQMFFFCFDLI